MTLQTPPKRVRAWHLANTTVRTPYRLRGGLEALLAGGFEGNMGKKMEEEIAYALDEAGIVSLLETTEDVTSITRKWRHALVKLGFIWPDPVMLNGGKKLKTESLGKPFTVTPNGRRLLLADSLQAQQEVFLRSLSALRLPSPIEPNFQFRTFSPLRMVISVILSLEKAGEIGAISPLEMQAFVLFADSEKLDSTVAAISDCRKRRSLAESLRKFDVAEMDRISLVNGANKQTLRDYQDVTFRYLKATGLFQAKGRGITLIPEKRRTATLLVSEHLVERTPTEYLLHLAEGAQLPTDLKAGAQDVLDDLLHTASELEVDFDLSPYDLHDPKGLSLARFNLEAAIFVAKERVFAREQPKKFKEIIGYLELLSEKKSRKTVDGQQISFRKEESPAYFEWALWRVLLALGGLSNSSEEVRRFKIDQDFLPVSTASGGGADVVAIYPDCALVVEVTLTENSRQEAAEGEPVRRHVANVLEGLRPYQKDVYGLFVARRIDTNTVETFRIGVWYLKDDERVALDIVPVSLQQLIALLTSGVARHGLTPEVLLGPIKDLTNLRKQSTRAPEWKSRIEDYIDLQIGRTSTVARRGPSTAISKKRD